MTDTEKLALRARIRELMWKLEKINDLDPSIDSEEGFNEWGGAECFNQAQEIAKEALSRTDDLSALDAYVREEKRKVLEELAVRLNRMMGGDGIWQHEVEDEIHRMIGGLK